MGLAYNLLLYFVLLILLMISALGYTALDPERAMVEVQSVMRQFLPHSEQAFADARFRCQAVSGAAGMLRVLIFELFNRSFATREGVSLCKPNILLLIG